MLKKSQMKMMESILVLIIFFFLLVFGIVFYTRFSQSDAEDQFRERMLRQGMDATERFQYSPEVLCVGVRGDVRTDCFDLINLDIFKKVAEDRYLQYSQIYPNMVIEGNIIFPESKERSWVIYNSSSEELRAHSSSFIPAAFFNATSRQNYFGFIKIEAWY